MAESIFLVLVFVALVGLVVGFTRRGHRSCRIGIEPPLQSIRTWMSSVLIALCWVDCGALILAAVGYVLWYGLNELTWPTATAELFLCSTVLGAVSSMLAALLSPGDGHAFGKPSPSSICTQAVVLVTAIGAFMLQVTAWLSFEAAWLNRIGPANFGWQVMWLALPTALVWLPILLGFLIVGFIPAVCNACMRKVQPYTRATTRIASLLLKRLRKGRPRSARKEINPATSPSLENP